LFSENFLKEIDELEVSKTVVNSCENFIYNNNLYDYKFVEINTKKIDSINFNFENLKNFKIIFIEELTLYMIELQKENEKLKTKISQIEGERK
jgi:hypothetical protein